METWDIYDASRIKKGRTMKRGGIVKEGDFHLVVHICVFNSKGEMLIQQRQPFKKGWSNLWDITVGGSSIAGETSQEAASRELFEEIGLSVDFSKDRPHFTINFDEGFDDFYFVWKDVDLSTLVLQKEEVQNVDWASKEKIMEMIDNKQFIPYFRGLITLLFEANKQYGCIQNC